MDPHTEHLPAGESGRLLLETADVLLSPPDGSLWPSHLAVLAVHSSHLAVLARLQPAGALSAEFRGRLLPIVCVAPAGGCGAVPAMDEFGTSFLGALYSPSADFEWKSIAGVVALADYFGATSLLHRADAWLCAQLRAAPPADDLPCQAFELATRHRLGGATALLLPYMVQCLARGSRCAAVWYDGKQRCSRIRAAFEDSDLKCLVLDAYWWCREAQAECPTCRCRPADIETSWDTRLEWAGTAPGGGARSGYSPGGCTLQLGSAAHARAVQHYAHLLREAQWATTPPEAGAALAAVPAAAH